MKYWVTMNKKMTGQSFPVLSYNQLLDRIFSLVRKYVKGWVFIETGPRWETMLVDYFAKNQMKALGVWPGLYGPANALLNMVTVFGCTHDEYVGRLKDRTTPHLRDAALPREVVRRVRVVGGVVLDPCCGMGFTAKAACHNGMRFVGNEFNRKRLQKTINFLQSTVKGRLCD